MNTNRETTIELLATAESIDEVFDLLGISPVSSEAYYVELLWEALKK